MSARSRANPWFGVHRARPALPPPACDDITFLVGDLAIEEYGRWFRARLKAGLRLPASSLVEPADRRYQP